MKRSEIHILAGIMVLMLSCVPKESKDMATVPDPTLQLNTVSATLRDSATYYDKILGALVGSAIGDAMGASTEMWSGAAIREEFGYITGLTLVERSKSAEGTWQHNMDSGATTDDTRWKYLMVQYFLHSKGAITPDSFAQYIIDYYQAEAKELSRADLLEDIDVLEGRIQRIDWIREWARVAMAYRSGPVAYAKAQSRFYGGEMSCAGMLYSPIFGLITSTPEEAYETAFDHGLFDLGYARDITGLVAAMTQMAMYNDSISVILKRAVLVDPHKYMDSRLIGRLSYTSAKDTKQMIRSAKKLSLADTMNLELPQGYPGSRSEWMEQLFIYGELEKRSQDISFHAGEIWQILVASLYFGEGDFRKTMQFIVNYGRDNDTVAAVAGMILGAQLGYSGLPVDLRKKVVEVSRETMGIDLEALAATLVEYQLEATL
ncbi:MAG: ADP-ribosylglycohydrolase family protein [Bacteroidota bacterium]